MRVFAPLLLLSLSALLFACPSNKECVEGDFLLSNLAPADGSDRVAPFAVIAGTLTPNATRLEIDVSDSLGPVYGLVSFNANGRDFSFTPDRPLAPGTVNVALDIEGCSDGWSFTASGATPHGAGLVTNTYRMSPTLVDNISPRILGSLLQSTAEQQPSLLLQVTAFEAETGSLILRAGWATAGNEVSETGEQDLCAEAVELPPVGYSGPVFGSEPVDWDFSMYGKNFRIEGMTISGWMKPDGSSIETARITGLLDLRPLEEAMDVRSTDVCMVTVDSPTPCEACANDGEVACLPFELDGIEAALVEAPPLIPSSGPSHPGCVSN